MLLFDKLKPMLIKKYSVHVEKKITPAYNNHLQPKFTALNLLISIAKNGAWSTGVIW